MRNYILKLNIVITIDIENITLRKSDCALLILNVAHVLISTNDE